MRRCYIVTRQVFFKDRSFHYQCADYNPIVEVFTTEKAAVDRVKRIVESHLLNAEGRLHRVFGEIDAECVYRVGCHDDQGYPEFAYSVIKKGLVI